MEQVKAADKAVGITYHINFVDGRADDAEAFANGCSESWNNGMVEGFVNKVKWIKRSSYGQAGFPLLQRRVLLHPSNLATGRKTKKCSANRPVIILPSRGTIFSRAATTVASPGSSLEHETQTAL